MAFMFFLYVFLQEDNNIVLFYYNLNTFLKYMLSLKEVG